MHRAISNTPRANCLIDLVFGEHRSDVHMTALLATADAFLIGLLHAAAAYRISVVTKDWEVHRRTVTADHGGGPAQGVLMNWRGSVHLLHYSANRVHGDELTEEQRALSLSSRV